MTNSLDMAEKQMFETSPVQIDFFKPCFFRSCESSAAEAGRWIKRRGPVGAARSRARARARAHSPQRRSLTVTPRPQRPQPKFSGWRTPVRNKLTPGPKTLAALTNITRPMARRLRPPIRHPPGPASWHRKLPANLLPS